MNVSAGSGAGGGNLHPSRRTEAGMRPPGETQLWRTALSSKFCTENFSDCHLLISQENASTIALLIAAILLQPMPQGVPQNKAVSLHLLLPGF
jgi:hypothetical protein